MRNKIIVITLLLSFSIYLFAQQGNLNSAKELINQGKYLEGAKLLRPLADGGNAEAQELAAWLFFSGKGVTASNEQGIRYATKAAEQGRIGAASMLIAHHNSNLQKDKAIEVFGNFTCKYPEMGVELVQEMDEECLNPIVGGYFEKKMSDFGITNSETFIEKLYETNPIEGELFMELSIVSRGNASNYYNRVKQTLNNSENQSLGFAILAKLAFEGKGIQQNHRRGMVYATNAAKNGSHMGKYLLQKYQNELMPGYFYRNAVMFSMDKEKGNAMVFSREEVVCNWKEIKGNLQQMKSYMRLPTMEEAKEMMPYYCWAKGMKSGETVTIWTVRLVLADVYYWQTYDHNGNLIKEEPHHNYLGSAYNGNATLVTVWQTNL